jgi:hypothetical protein
MKTRRKHIQEIYLFLIYILTCLSKFSLNFPNYYTQMEINNERFHYLFQFLCFTLCVRFSVALEFLYKSIKYIMDNILSIFF